MTIEPTTDHEVIRKVCGDLPLPDYGLWVDKITVLVAKEGDEPKMGLLLVGPEYTETGETEAHIHAPSLFTGAIEACAGFKRWVIENTSLKQVWSYTVDRKTFRFAKAFGLEHAFDHNGKNFLVLNIPR